MKKILITILLALILATGSVFADHPKGFGIGITGNYGIGWGGAGTALALKFPGVPVFWTANLGFDSDFTRIGITGDNYLIDQKLASVLHWYLGLGGWFDYYSKKASWFGKEYYAASFGFGARLPIGLSLQPVPILEVFLEAAPSLGILIKTEAKYKDFLGFEHVWQESGTDFPAWGVPVVLGLRFWF